MDIRIVFYILITGLLIILVSDILQFIKDRKGATQEKKPKKKIDLRALKINKVTNYAGKKIGNIRKHIENMSTNERKKSLIYKYYNMMNNILISLNIASITNPETLLLLITILSLIVSVILCTGLGLILTIICWITVFSITHSILYFFSRTETIARVNAMIDAEDILGSNMERGIIVAVSENIEALNPRIQPLFRDFLFNINRLKMPMDKALRLLNISLGPQMDKFCENSLTFYIDNDPVKLNDFRKQIQKNSKRRTALLKREKNFKNNLTLYVVGTGITIVFSFLAIGLIADYGEYISSYHGRVATIAGLIFGFLGFTLSQITYSGGVD